MGTKMADNINTSISLHDLLYVLYYIFTLINISYKIQIKQNVKSLLL